MYQVGTCAGNPTGSETVDYLVVAGGGGGGSDAGGGGGAGGYRESSAAASGCYKSPRCLCFSITSFCTSLSNYSWWRWCVRSGCAAKGNPSIFSTITSAGGGTGDGPYMRSVQEVQVVEVVRLSLLQEVQVIHHQLVLLKVILEVMSTRTLVLLVEVVVEATAAGTSGLCTPQVRW
jgi:hypothetical protein